MKVLNDLNLPAILERVERVGYCFQDNAVTSEALSLMEAEIESSNLERGDHITYPINKGTIQEVQQYHERLYCMLDDPQVPVGNAICYALAQEIPLPGWLLNEIGYQRYRDHKDWIGPHRDRRSDRILSITFTIKGSAWINIYKSEVDPPDYKRLYRIDSHLASTGCALFLKAPGLGDGEQTIHEVMPPIDGSRLILNLRMRPTLLPPPSET